MKHFRAVFVLTLILGLALPAGLWSLGLAAAQGGSITYGETVTGNASGSPDEWTFEGTVGDQIAISMVSEDFDTYLILYDNTGTEVERNDDGGEGLNSLLEITLPATGTYTIEANSFNRVPDGAYTLTLTLVTASGGGDSSGEATLTPGEPVTGELTGDGNPVLYTFEAAAGDVVTISMVSDDFDTFLILQDASGATITSNDDGGEGLNSLIEAFTIPATGTYIINASSYRDTASGSFELTLSGTVLGSDGGNDSAGADLVYGDSVTGVLTGGEAVPYNFNATAGDVVTISMVSDDFDTYLTLLDSTGNIVTTNDDGGEGLNSLIEAFTIASTGTYTIEAGSFSSSASGSFTLELSAEGVSNGGDNGGGTASSGSFSVTESLSSESAEYPFSGSAGDVITISLSSEDFDTLVELYGPGGELLERDDDGGEGFNSLIDNFELPSTGTYTITVRAFAFAEDAGTFTLDFSTTGTGTTPPPDGNGDNGSTSSATVITDTLSDSIYTTTFTAGSDPITISLESDAFDPVLEIYDADAQLIASDDDSGDNGSALLQDFTFPAPGDYTIVVRAWAASGSGAFTLSIGGDGSTGSDTGSDTSEGSISFGTVVTAELSDGQAVPFTFQASAGDVVSIAMNSEDFDTLLVLEDANGTEIARNDDGGPGLNSLIEGFVIPSTGTYTIQAGSFSSLAAGSFSLELNAGDIAPEATEEPAPFETEPAPFETEAAPFETEAAPVETEAAPVETEEAVEGTPDNLLRSGAEVRATLSSGTPVPFQFRAEAGDVVTIAMNSEDFDTLLQLLDSTGAQVARDDDGGPGLDSLIDGFVIPSTGIYTINATSFSSSASGSFTLTLTIE